ncbi:hypothetical protein [Caulobacter sp. FWC2]|uniref:hypothetical protein n=1 Tax=Caulobacter sp. FWC2 TaxID=69664 RepID=UPI000C14542C|nr:hypothetical protein [Caulobacter sp. FWC2]PIB92290.1 hypothetical protein CSW62_12350 [Caulobacter sp. FWC2]
MEAPAIRVTSLIDAVVESIGGADQRSRVDVHIAIFNHAMLEIVRASEGAPERAYARDRILAALTRVIDDTLLRPDVRP